MTQLSMETQGNKFIISSDNLSFSRRDSIMTPDSSFALKTYYGKRNSIQIKPLETCKLFG